MPSRSTRLVLGAALAAATGCGDATAPAPREPVLRTIVVHQLQTRENVLLNTDGTSAGPFNGGAAGMVPVGGSSFGQTVAFLNGTALVLASLNQPARYDTVLLPVPQQMSLVSFSADESCLALVAYTPVQAILVLDRVNHRVDTLPYGAITPILPPMIGPDNDRIALLDMSDLSFTLVVLWRTDPARREGHVLRVSRVLNRPVYGWPRWTDDGLLVGFVRTGEPGPDTILVGRIDPDDSDAGLEERYRAVLAPAGDSGPGLVFQSASTYALSADGTALILAADPNTGAPRHALYLVFPDVGRVRPLFDDPAVYPVFPLFVRE